MNKNEYIAIVIADTSFNLFKASRLAKYIEIDCANVENTCTIYVLEGENPNISDLMGYSNIPFPEAKAVARIRSKGIITGICDLLIFFEI